ncbi:hypothetical protein [Planomonospora venezuelensis]|uniref:Lipoprotein n=1 Tax=Planomonospora venezuelensis TaxID=1999 RepID=A0A841D025_PLAVE|nr:hypothetical protein [Planomonospora venezuelensis]MBB5964012.1 hypothetical protein [Planomonospora venezuelensis]GIN05052.1 hypothetical protein Pve01_67100 [Planomonospora venezuelensis]
MIATLTGAAAAALAVPALVAPANAAPASTAPAGAQAAPADPVSALRKQFRPGRGVKLTEQAKLIGEGRTQRVIFGRRGGVLEFGRKGVTASDLTSTFSLPGANKELVEEFKDMFAPSRTITVKGVSYTSSAFYAGAMPEGKKWLRTPAQPVSPGNPAQQLVNPLEPATLKAALAHTTSRRPGGTWDGARTVVHSGTITLGELYRVSPTVRGLLGAEPSAKSAPLRVSWQLYIGPDQLVRRAVSSWTQSMRGLTSVDLTYLNDSRYTGWGVKSAIKAPPAAQVAEFEELDLEGKAEDPFTRIIETAG